MVSLKLYQINTDYLKYLNQIDKRVIYNHGHHNRPYLGIITMINQFEYFIPLSSPKAKHTHMHDNVTFIKLMNRAIVMSVLNISNMVPVPKSEYHQLNFSQFQTNYRNLLNDEYYACKAKRKKIISNANKLHTLVTNDYSSRLVERCCDYHKLEQACAQYSSK